ncbi:17S U2 SnRNP complex component HTATSF1 isoform X1 [Dermacentor andersoni]|uniref:17S U2 SnRNP complex component HTATSF1 isoform X1 n=1 Tax=Dermacentor andersoni TaxID=34620 RepID=UPI0021558DA7|nr:HIV Tat-specific factor 1 homolog isoform X1 [Dermacentor andersoni]
MSDEFQQQLELEKAEKERQQSSGSDPYTYVDPNDGTVYEWDHDKHAWFPKLTEDFLAAYQANYGTAVGTPSEGAGHTSGSSQVAAIPEKAAVPAVNPSEQLNPKKPDKGKPAEPGWFEIDDAHNTRVYVSNLPDDIDEEEFFEMMSKCGLVMKDEKGQFKIKLYRTPDGQLKGDALCCYIKVESVELALRILDGYRLRDKEIRVERARFQLKGAYDPTKKPKKKKQASKDKERLKKKIDKLFDWRPEKLRGMRDKHESTVVLKNMFGPQEFEKDPTLILEYQKDLREECGQFGEVKKVVVYDRHPEGIATVTFKEPEEADACISRMNGRWFAQRQLSAETWDGRTRYKIYETEEELEERLKKWDEYLDGEEEEKAKGSTSGTSAAPPSSVAKREAEDGAEAESGASTQKRPKTTADESTE